MNDPTLLRTRLLSLLLAVTAVAGCAVGPDYVAPETRAPEDWNATLAGGLSARTADPAALAQWWTVLKDPVLNELMSRAAAGSPDLRQAQARVREARARRGISRADLFPTLKAGGSASSSSSSENTGGSGDRRELYSAAFDASWEIDVFGGVRRSVEAAQADLEASEEDYRDVLVTLFAEVALNYVELRTFQSRVALAEANLQTQTETYDLTRWRFEAGLTSQLDVEQALSSLESTRARLPGLRASLEQSRNRLAVLTGEAPGALDRQLAEPKPIPVTPLEIAVGVPAETLRRRPDVRRAERELAAQTARVGVATAQQYPSFSLSGAIGWDALASGDLFSSASRRDSTAGSIAWTIFNAGAIRRNIEVQNAIQEQALISYESTVLGALEEVEGALTDYAREQERRQALIRGTAAADNAAKLARDQYASGLVDFQEVLISERTLLSFQDELAQSEGTVTSNLVRLYKALGGGWTPLSPPQAGAG